MSREAVPKTSDASNYRRPKGDCRGHRLERLGAGLERLRPDCSNGTPRCGIFNIGAMLVCDVPMLFCQSSVHGYTRLFSDTVSADFLHCGKCRRHEWPSSKSTANPV